MARKSILAGTTIPPLCRRIGPGDWHHPDPAAVVDAWPEPHEALKAGILAMAKTAKS